MKYLLTLFLTACASAPVARGPASTALPDAVFKVSSARAENQFAKIREPYLAPAKAIGGYSAGCLQGAIPMPKSGPGFEMMRLSRNRYYAHPALAEVLLRAGRELAHDGNMLYGDLAQPRGGPMPGGHASHQSGLDADIWFYHLPAGKKLNDRQREKIYGGSVVKKNWTELNERAWKPVYGRQLMWFAGQPETERIFVNATIKQRLCREYPGDPRLARLRPWFFHHDHFHLRLKCPVGEASCVPQPPADGIECDDKDLAGWYSPETLAKVLHPKPTPPFEAALPLECKQLL